MITGRIYRYYGPYENQKPPSWINTVNCPGSSTLTVLYRGGEGEEGGGRGRGGSLTLQTSVKNETSKIGAMTPHPSLTIYAFFVLFCLFCFLGGNLGINRIK